MIIFRTMLLSNRLSRDVTHFWIARRLYLPLMLCFLLVFIFYFILERDSKFISTAVISGALSSAREEKNQGNLWKDFLPRFHRMMQFF